MPKLDFLASIALAVFASIWASRLTEEAVRANSKKASLKAIACWLLALLGLAAVCWRLVESFLWPAYDPSIACAAEYRITDSCLSVSDSWLIHDDRAKSEVILKALSENGAYPRRGLADLLIEWRAHNILHG